MLPNICYEAKITQKPNKKVNYRPESLMNIDAKILNKILAIWIKQYFKQGAHHNQVGSIPGMQNWFYTHINLTHHINKRKTKNMIISISTEKASDKTQHSFMIKTL